MIYTLTLNPALDNIIEVDDKLSPGKNNQINRITKDVGGKGTHVSIALTILGEKNRCLGIGGSNNYQELKEKLNDFEVDTEFILIPNQTVRNNYILIDDSTQSSILLTEAGEPIEKQEINALMDQILNALSKEDYIIVAGNPCKYTSEENFDYLFKKIVQTGAKICVDLHGKYLDIALKYPLYFAKPNQFEFSHFVNKEMKEPTDVIDYLRNNKLDKVSILSVSLGKLGSVIKTDYGLFLFEALKVNTVNDTGSGDAYFAGMIYGLANNKNIIECGKLATAIGAAKAEERLSSGFNLDRVNALINKVQFREVSEII